ncbi:unnamed protein product [Mytilus edulis]|uniref:ATP-dependent DNA helicase n=1 Tax=Mytilus edulis TaxID=6550 RepID=A0A8S3TCB0_MYTED|nr:unnamed protein product [Mytilus edulis]
MEMSSSEDNAMSPVYLLEDDVGSVKLRPKRKTAKVLVYEDDNTRTTRGTQEQQTESQEQPEETQEQQTEAQEQPEETQEQTKTQEQPEDILSKGSLYVESKSKQEKSSGKINEEQSVILKLAESGHNLFLTGQAGTGKTFTLGKIVSSIQINGRNFVKVASTEKAASVLKDKIETPCTVTTIHRFFGILDGRYGNEELVNLMFGTANFIHSFHVVQLHTVQRQEEEDLIQAINENEDDSSMDEEEKVLNTFHKVADAIKYKASKKDVPLISDVQATQAVLTAENLTAHPV